MEGGLHYWQWCSQWWSQEGRRRKRDAPQTGREKNTKEMQDSLEKRKKTREFGKFAYFLYFLLSAIESCVQRRSVLSNGSERIDVLSTAAEQKNAFLPWYLRFEVGQQLLLLQSKKTRFCLGICDLGWDTEHFVLCVGVLTCASRVE